MEKDITIEYSKKVAELYTTKRLNAGCGRDIREGWINLDSARLPGVDVVHDIEKLPLPFGNGEFDEILCNDVLEHVEYIPVLKDLHRILNIGGKLTVRVPHFTSRNNYIDPTHKKQFSINTFDFFAKNTLTQNSHLEKERLYYFDFAFDRVAIRRITFEKSSRIFFYNKLVEPIINSFPKIQEFYESSFLCWDFPAMNIEIELIK